MKNKILRYVGVGIVGFVVLIIIIVLMSNSDSSRSQVATAPVVDVVASTTKAVDTKPVAANVSTSTYGVRLKTSDCVSNQSLPDSDCTPGAILAVDVKTICVSGYSATVRDVPDSLKKQVFQEYGISYDLHSNYEVDHLISLELGGSNDIANLWPESYTITDNARTKDKLENWLHGQVCSGTMTLTEAQYEISHDWLKYFDQAGLSKAQPATSIQPAQTSSSTGSKYYTSVYATAKYYYPESCSAWKSLSSSNLKSFATLADLRAAYPLRTLSPQCQ